METVVDYIEAIRKASGKSKQAVLASVSAETKEILKYVYDDKKYGVTKIEQTTVGGAYLENTSWSTLLDALASKKLTGNNARTYVQAMLNDLTPANAYVLIGVLQKNLRVGIGKKTIATVFPGLIDVWSVMLAKPFEDKLFTPDLLWSIKRDGVRAYYHRGDHQLYTRGKKVLVGFEHIKDALYEIGHDFDGELEIPGLHFSKSSGLIRSNAQCPTAVYYVFDTPSIKQPFKKRYAFFKEACKDMGPHVSPLKHVAYDSSDKVHSVFDAVLAKGFEGLMAKTPYHLYQQKRSSDWLKLKVGDACEECVIENTYPGEGLCVGAGGIVVTNSKGVSVKVGTGFSDLQRVYLKMKKPVGSRVKINFQEYTTDGSFRHPRLAPGEMPVPADMVDVVEALADIVKSREE